jgi:hypothetical protein
MGDKFTDKNIKKRKSIIWKLQSEIPQPSFIFLCFIFLPLRVPTFFLRPPKAILETQ